jgi:hypothetical protein
LAGSGAPERPSASLAQARQRFTQEALAVGVTTLSRVELRIITDHMPEKYLDTFIKINEQNRSKAEIQRFVQEHVPNAGQVFANAFCRV